MRNTVKEELSRRETLLSKIKYLSFAYKFEITVFLFIVGFISFFTYSIFIHDNAVLNLAIYTSSKKAPNSIQISNTQEKVNNALNINYGHNRDTCEVMAGSTKKISDEMKLKAMLNAKQVDVLIFNKHGFDTLKKDSKNLRIIPHKLKRKFKSSDLYVYKGKTLGIAAKKLPIIKEIDSNPHDIFCLPANGINKKEANKFVNFLAKKIN